MSGCRHPPLEALPAAVPAAQPVPDLVPGFVRPLFAQPVPGRNDSSPTWSPVAELLAVERSNEVRREIVVAGVPTARWCAPSISQANADDLGLADLLPELGVSISYNSGLAWSPQGRPVRVHEQRRRGQLRPLPGRADRPGHAAADRRFPEGRPARAGRRPDNRWCSCPGAPAARSCSCSMSTAAAR
ncbi:MAG: hypothetical protein MZV65_12500 [Chromatiales bacterium]|nr:hypothetical protein [Chromatiales bacterium]